MWVRKEKASKSEVIFYVEFNLFSYNYQTTQTITHYKIDALPKIDDIIFEAD